MATEAHSKWLQRALGLYPVLWSTWHRVTVDQAGFLITISADHISLVPSHMHLSDSMVDDEYNQSLSDNSVRDPGQQKDRPGQNKKYGSQTQKYTVDHIIRHVGNCGQKGICGAMEWIHAT